MMFEFILLLIFYTLDTLGTYIFFVLYTKEYPQDTKYYKREFNKILRLCYKKYGLHKGTRIAFIIILPVILAIIYVSSLYSFYFGLFVGAYMIVLLTHYVNIKYFLEEVKKKREKRENE